MRRWSKRVMSIFLAATMVIGLTACGGKGSTKADKEEAKKYVYKMQEIAADFINENTNIYDAVYQNDRMYLLTNEQYWDEMTGTVVKLVSMLEDGSDVQEVELFNNLRENPDYSAYEDGIIDDGIAWEEDITDDFMIEDSVVEEDVTEDGVTEDGAVEEDVTEDGAVEEDATEGDVIMDGNVDMEMGIMPLSTEVYSSCYINSAAVGENGVYFVMENNSYYYDDMGNDMSGGYSLELYAYSLEGEEQYSVTLNDNADEYLYISSITADEEGNLALMSDSAIYVYDASGEKTSEVDISSINGYVQNSFFDKEGKLNMVTYTDEWTKLSIKIYNLKTNSFEKEIELPGNLTNYGIRAGKNYDLLLTNSLGVYGYNIGDTDVTQILSYINSDLDGNSINQVYEAKDNGLICIYYDEETWTQSVAALTYVDPSEIPDKEVLILGCYYLDYYMRKRVVEFNKENDLYRIVVKDYSNYSTTEDYGAGFTQLNNDILAGQMPDILIMSDNMPIDSYIAKGLLADIGKMIEEDEELDMNDYMTNVFDAYSVDGKLYSVIPSFYVYTVIGKTSDVGETPGWTMDDLKALMEANPNASVFGETMTRSSVLWNTMMFSGSRFVDSATGKCNFDSEEFIELLEFIAQFPEEYDWENMDNNYWIDSETQYRDGRTLLMQTSIYDFREYASVEQAQFGEPITLIGFPTEEGNGAVVNANGQYAISAKSGNKEGAWEFLRYYLTEEYQTSDEVDYTLPTNKNALLEKLEEAKERPYWTDENGEKVYYDQTYWLVDQEVTINPLTDEEADMLFEYISSITMSSYYDEDLENIIMEEAEAFFEGQKSVAEVAKIIQSRAQIYINESR